MEGLQGQPDLLFTIANFPKSEPRSSQNTAKGESTWASLLQSFANESLGRKHSFPVPGLSHQPKAVWAPAKPEPMEMT